MCFGKSKKTKAIEPTIEEIYSAIAMADLTDEKIAEVKQWFESLSDSGKNIVRFSLKKRFVKISKIQLTFRIGYAEAARALDSMCEIGIAVYSPNNHYYTLLVNAEQLGISDPEQETEFLSPQTEKEKTLEDSVSSQTGE